MENFYLAVQAIAKSISLHISVLITHPFFWGFCFGFFVAALVSVLIITNNPINVCAILLHKDPLKSYSRIGNKKKKGSKKIHFNDFKIVHSLVRFLFLIVVFIFLLIVLISILTYSVIN